MRVSGGTVPLGTHGGPRPDGDVVVGVRPEDLSLMPDGPLSASVTIVELLGADVQVISGLPDGTRVVVRQDAHHPKPNIGESIRIGLGPDARPTMFDATSGHRLEAE